MFRGCRCIILAVTGLALIGAAKAPQPPANAENTKPAQTIASQPAPANLIAPKKPVAPSPDQGCERGQDDRKSDLCAQWKAADAAKNAADWSWWQLWIGIVGLILGGITMAAAIAAALYAKRAAVATEETVGIAKDAASGAEVALNIAGRNADAAVKLADQSEQSAARQLKAYAHIQSVIFYHGYGDSEAMHVLVAVANHGQTPAKITLVQIFAKWDCDGVPEQELIGQNEIKINVTCYKDLPVQMPFKLGTPDSLQRKGKLVIEGDIFYTDIFDAKRQSSFIFTSGLDRFFEIEDGHRFTYLADEMETKISN
jgi:hypothetical protein